jgi:hypothetical protein
MALGSEAQYGLLQQQIHNSLQKADAHKDKLQRTNIRYSILNIILGALTTFVTGQAALAGEQAENRWRITCAIASGFALSATVVASLQSQLASPDLITEASGCVGKLKALNVEVNTIDSIDDLEQIKEKYQQILSEFSNIDC